jgi:hypothetical protein
VWVRIADPEDVASLLGAFGLNLGLIFGISRIGFRDFVHGRCLVPA